MIIVKLRGGLGNQLFQYAIGRCLAVLNSDQLQLDISDYVHDKPDPQQGTRVYCLKHFKIVADIAESKGIGLVKKNSVVNKIKRRVSKFLPWSAWQHYLEPDYQRNRFNKKLLQVKSQNKIVYLEGYWQSQDYFLPIKSIIKHDLQVKTPIAGANLAYWDKITHSDSVLLHVRHGDNANQIAAIHGVLSLGYYRQAVALIKERVANPKFFVFSDDLPWVKENLQLEADIEFVDCNDDEHNYEDLRLMSACRHYITGNSAFSWWGAWLGQDDGSVVIAPRDYHIGDNIAQTDFYPKDWIIL